MTDQQASLNRSITRQLTADAAALPLADGIILHDFAQSITITSKQAVLAFIRAFFQVAFAEMSLEMTFKQATA